MTIVNLVLALFEPEAMKKMFDAAHDRAAKGYPWLKRPPKVL